MKCEDVIEILGAREQADTLPARAARAHLDDCAQCAAAVLAANALRAERYVPAPRLPAGSFARALERATRPHAAQPARERGFWLGVTAGGALAASLAVAAALLWLPEATGPLGNPEVRLAVNEVRTVSMSLESPEALTGAEIRIVLTGGVGLAGFGTQRELRWTTNLDRGVNELTLPLVGLDARGGQITVEVQHSAKRRTLVIDVQPSTGVPSDDAA